MEANNEVRRSDKYISKDGWSISKEEWERLSDDRSYTRIALNEMRGGRDPEVQIRVSTVWTGINTGSREVFETMVLRDGEPVEERRYHSEGEAQEGHNEILGKHMLELPGPRLVREVPLEED